MVSVADINIGTLMMRVILQLWLLNCLALLVRGYPTGPPDSVCSSMNPQDGHRVAPQTGRSLFHTIMSKDTFSANEKLTVILIANGDVLIKGFMIQARAVDDFGLELNGLSVGTFPDHDNDNNATRSMCSGTTRSHRHRLAAAAVIIRWKAPSKGDLSSIKNVKFLSTIVQDKSVFWIQVPSTVVKVTSGSSSSTPKQVIIAVSVIVCWLWAKR